MASGLAVLAYDYAAARQYIKPEVNGFIVNANDPNSFMAKGISLAKEEVDLQNIKNNARKTTLEISWEKVTKKLEESYQELLNQSHLKNKIPSSIALREFVIKQ